LFNLNFNHSFNQTSIFSNQPQLKVLFIKQLFSNHNHNSNRNTKHTLRDAAAAVMMFFSAGGEDKDSTFFVLMQYFILV
jgi:hypothetical protein